MNAKPFWQSWTLWVNTLVIIGMALQYLTSVYVIDPQTQTALLALANVLLRLKTKEPLTMTPSV